MTIPDWLNWARKIQSLAQSGLTYAKHPSEIERYKSLISLSAEIVEKHSQEPLDYILKLFGTEKGYATPKIGVRALVTKSEKILFVQEKYGEKWNLPGGWVETGDSLRNSIKREVKEEAGVEIEVGRLLALWDADRNSEHPYLFHGYHLCFLCEWVEGTPCGGDETCTAKFMAHQEISNYKFIDFLKPKLSDLFNWKNSPPTEVIIDE